MSPQSVESAANVSREALEEYVQFQQSRRQAILQQRPLPSTPEIDPSVRNLYAGISTGMRSFWGSNEERSEARANLFSMQITYVQPTIFFTLTPDCASTYRIAHLAGNISNEVVEEMNSGLHQCLTYTKAKLGEIATANPYICARYFDYLMNVFY
ncbi:hypothetical protein F443_06259 [Phytophthora nicotianae P1569]|uniref:Helitron helicase-like domain-containing protein n=1 Tax=Phytophthora nicotianae P1569 TaxID=1317065 RepID=V9FH47_PHYNI|nr:hypothetical protein F443_06259 [Phytophthora nicotianae P1569]